MSGENSMPQIQVKSLRFGVICAEVIPNAHWCAPSGELQRKVCRVAKRSTPKIQVKSLRFGVICAEVIPNAH